MSDKEKNGNGKRGVNWTGIAALVTALGGVLGMFFVQDKSKSESDKISESVFVVVNQRISAMETRLHHIEIMMMQNHYAPAMIEQSECYSDGDCSEGNICDGGICVEENAEGEIAMTVESDEPSAMIEDFKDIKEFVQKAGRPVELKQ